MKRLFVLAYALTSLSCGYKMVAWTSDTYQTIEVLPVEAVGLGEVHELTGRLRDALMTRFLASSGLNPVKQAGDLTLRTTLKNVDTETLATANDGRTERLQLALVARFELLDRNGQQLWLLDNYRYTEQIAVAISTRSYVDETVDVQEASMRAVADLVVNNVTLVISELDEAG